MWKTCVHCRGTKWIEGSQEYRKSNKDTTRGWEGVRLSPCTGFVSGLMKTRQFWKYVSADRRSKLGVCSPSPSLATPRFSLSLLHGDFELAGSKVTGNSLVLFHLLFLKCFKAQKKKNLTDTRRSDWVSLLIFHSSFYFLRSFLAVGFKVLRKRRKRKRGAAWKRVKEKKNHPTTEHHPQNNRTLLFWKNISSQRARRSALVKPLKRRTLAGNERTRVLLPVMPPPSKEALISIRKISPWWVFPN